MICTSPTVYFWTILNRFRFYADSYNSSILRTVVLHSDWSTVSMCFYAVVGTRSTHYFIRDQLMLLLICQKPSGSIQTLLHAVLYFCCCLWSCRLMGLDLQFLVVVHALSLAKERGVVVVKHVQLPLRVCERATTGNEVDFSCGSITSFVFKLIAISSSPFGRQSSPATLVYPRPLSSRATIISGTGQILILMSDL